jgi:hypothetical protein
VSSSSLGGAKKEAFWDVVIHESQRRKGSVLQSAAEEMLQRFQMRQFMHSAQRLRDPERVWFAFSEKAAYIMNVAAGVELEAARMCSDVRMACADMGAKLKVICDEFKVAGVRCEQERLSKHKVRGGGGGVAQPEGKASGAKGGSFLPTRASAAGVVRWHRSSVGVGRWRA